MSTKNIILSTINAKFIHTSLGLRYLFANLKSHQKFAEIAEFTLEERSIDIAEKLLKTGSRTILFSCYIWNIELTTDVVKIIKSINPSIIIILGGPEVSFENDLPDVANYADHIISGEAELVLPHVIDSLMNEMPVPYFQTAPVPNLTELTLPYSLYSDSDIQHRVIYVESSRGCAFGCEFCISSLDKKVRYFEIERILEALDELWQRGVRQFKFIDRTIHLNKAEPILQFFLDRICPELFLHFEIVPDRVSDNLIEMLSAFPNGAVQLEAGIQTFNDEVSKRISRNQNMDKAEQKLKTLIEKTGVHIHSDLVIGLPGENIDSLANSFNRLLSTGVHEIQVGILKRLRGAPISRHTESFQMKYRDVPPYDILQNRDIDFYTMQRLKRFSRYFDLVHNNGNFKTTAPLLWQQDNAFQCFLHFTDWLFSKTNRTSKIALDKLAEYLFEYITVEKDMANEDVANSLFFDFHSNGKRRFPKCVREFATQTEASYSKTTKSELPQRQKRHSV